MSQGRPDRPLAPRRSGPAPLHAPARLAALDATGLLEGPDAAAGSEVLDRLARAAARQARARLALVTLVGDDRQRFPGMAGLSGEAADQRTLPPRFGFCRRVAATGAPLVIPSAPDDPEFRDAPAVTELGMRAYAGVPLTVADGHTLGALCVFDDVPRAWSDDEVEGLRDLAAAATAELERRAAVAALRSSRDHYRALLRHYPDGAVFLVDRDLRLLVADGEALGHDGWPGGALEGRGLREVLPPVQADAVARCCRDAFDGREGTVALAVGERTYDGQVLPVRDAHDAVQAAMVIARDVTERERREREARRQGVLLDTVLASIPLMVVVFDVAGRPTWVNQEWERVLGWTVADMRTRDIMAESYPDAEVRAAAAAFMTSATGEWRRFAPIARDGAVVVSSWTNAHLADGRRIGLGRDDRPLLAAEAERAHSEQALREREALYRAVLDALPVGVIVSAPDGRLTHMNRRVHEIWGPAPVADGIAAYAEWRAWWADTGVALRAEDWALARALQHGETCRGERVEIARFDGDGRRTILNHAAPIHDASGRLLGGVVAATDVTEQVAADAAREAALRASEERFRALIEHAQEIVAVLGADGTMLYNSPAVHRVLGASPAALTGRHASELVHPEDWPAVAEALARVAVSAHASTTATYRCRHADGTWRTLEADAWNLADEPAVGGIVVHARDVTERTALEERLRHAQKMEAVGQLAGGVAHDFNNLLTVIQGNLAFAREGLPDALPEAQTVRDDLREVARAADRAAALVRQLLTFSRRQPNQPRAVPLAELVTGAHRMLQRVIGEEITLTVDVARADDVVVHADPGQLEQVLMNLAVNARDAMLTPRHGHPGTGGRLRFEVSADELTAADVARHGVPLPDVAPGRWARLVVSDSGHGMDAVTRAHLFEPFFTTKPVGAGTGLGLATVFGIVRQAGGTIGVRSAPGRGTTFTILLPLAPSASADDAASLAPSVGRGDGRVILLVEDEPPVRALARRTLERHGYVVLEARHGGDALELWQRHGARIAAVVTDVRMPAMGGRDLATLVRAARPGIPLVFVSGYSDGDAIAASGPSEAFVAKPFAPEALLAALGTVLALGHGRAA